MADVPVYIIAMVLAVIVVIVLWWFLKGSKTKKSRKSSRRPMKPLHPELLTDYKVSGRDITFKGNARTSEERKQEQKEEDWRR